MSVQLNHTIVWCRDKRKSALFLTEILGLPAARRWGPFEIVELANGVSLDFHETEAESGGVAPQHYAFLVGEEDFEPIVARIRAQSVRHWADPARRRAGEINHNDGGRGVYFEDPDGHLLEIITRPYGSGA
jgi:catechol 2,3-dioxygenase-like lactoylglutathione lyase family enzyme